MSGSDPFGPSNVGEIERLNQRGGRTLSFCDLIEAGTVSAELAGELAALIESGATILTAAGPGGAGKSTVLANLLACLPPGERIVTTPDCRAVDRAHSRLGRPVGWPEEAAGQPPPITTNPTCFLAHEIGSGPWFAYLWAGAAARFFALPSTGHRIATCLHADTIEELYTSLGSQGVSGDDMRSIGIVAFVVRVGRLRRVGSVHVPGQDGHRLRWRWDEASDSFEAAGDPAADPGRAKELAQAVEKLVEEDVRDFAEQRRRLARVLRPRSAS